MRINDAVTLAIKEFGEYHPEYDYINLDPRTNPTDWKELEGYFNKYRKIDFLGPCDIKEE